MLRTLCSELDKMDKSLDIRRVIGLGMLISILFRVSVGTTGEAWEAHEAHAPSATTPKHTSEQGHDALNAPALTLNPRCSCLLLFERDAETAEYPS